MLLAPLSCLTATTYAQYDTDGNGYAEVISLYRDEINHLIWNIADFSKGKEAEVVEVSFGQAQDYPLAGYYLAEDRANLAVLRKLEDSYELELQIGENRSFSAVHPDSFPVSILFGNLDNNDFTDIAIIKQRSPHRYIWNVYYNPFQSEKRRRLRFGSGEGQPLLAHSIRGKRELVAGYLPMRGHRKARIRFERRKRVLRFENLKGSVVDFSDSPLSLKSGYYFNAAHFSNRGRHIGYLSDTTSEVDTILPGTYWPDQNAPEIIFRPFSSVAAGGNGLCEIQLNDENSFSYACGLLQRQVVRDRNKLDMERYKNSSPEDGLSEKIVDILPKKATATPKPLPTHEPTTTLVAAVTFTAIPNLSPTPVSPPATPTLTATTTPTVTSTITPTVTSTITPTATSIPLPFVSVWKTDNTSGAVTANNQIKLPLESTGSYNFTVNWGDGSSNHINSWNQTEITHTYPSTGTYTVNISGSISGFRFGNAGDRTKIVDIRQWGVLRLGNNGGYFWGCSNLEASASDILDLTGTTNLANIFNGASKFNGSIGNWQTSHVTTLSGAFNLATSFNSEISAWDTSQVTDLSSTFRHAYEFNQAIGQWNTSNVTTLFRTFSVAKKFNQDLSRWNTSKVTSMNATFATSAFNHDLTTWDTSSVTDMSFMFNQAASFNGEVHNWNTSKVRDMQYMFTAATLFNQNIVNWDVSAVTNMYRMFWNASTFNRDLADWCVVNIGTEPGQFDDSAIAWTNDPGWRPRWGSNCS